MVSKVSTGSAQGGDLREISVSTDTSHGEGDARLNHTPLLRKPSWWRLEEFQDNLIRVVEIHRVTAFVDSRRYAVRLREE